MTVSMIIGAVGCLMWISGIVEEAETHDTYKSESIRITGLAVIFVAIGIAAVIEVLKQLK